MHTVDPSAMFLRQYASPMRLCLRQQARLTALAICGYADDSGLFFSHYCVNSNTVRECVCATDASMTFPSVTGSSVRDFALPPGEYGVFELF